MAIAGKPQTYDKVPANEVIYENEKTQVPSYGYGIRHVQAFIVFICMLIGYIARAHLGVSVVAMTTIAADPNRLILTNITGNNTIHYNGTDAIDLNDTNNEFEVNVTAFNISDKNEGSIWNVYRTYDWAKPTQEMILGAFFVGYCIAMFPTGMICQRFGGKLPLQSCLLINGIVSLATPTVAVWGGWIAVCCCRVLQGLSQAGLYPSAHTLLSKWVPISERATLASFVYSGTLIGTVLAFQIGGVMADSALGWPGIFWVTGALCITAFVMLTVFGAASPDVHKTISEAEKNFILGMIDSGEKKKAAKVPWKPILKSKHVWSTFATHAASGICFVFLFTQIPTYMHYILGYDVKNSGLLSSLPYVASAFTTIGFGVISDFCVNKGFVSTKAARITCNNLAQVVPALCLATMTFTYNSELAVFLLILALGLFAGIHSGWMVNYMDMSPNFSGSLVATGNTIATIGTIFLPVLVSNVVTDVYDRHQWRIVMFVMASMMFVSNMLFTIFMSSELQPWNQIEQQDDAETEMKPMETKPIKE